MEFHASLVNFPSRAEDIVRLSPLLMSETKVLVDSQQSKRSHGGAYGTHLRTKFLGSASGTLSSS